MIERLKTWNHRRRLSPHERFSAKAGRRIVENARRRTNGQKPRGAVVESMEGQRFAFTDRSLPTPSKDSYRPIAPEINAIEDAKLLEKRAKLAADIAATLSEDHPELGEDFARRVQDSILQVYDERV